MIRTARIRLRGGLHRFDKPFDPKELLARVTALLRRVEKTPLTPVLKYNSGDVVVDFERREVSKAGKPVNLAAKEMQLLRHLARIWQNQPFIGPRTVDVHMPGQGRSWNIPLSSPRIITVRGEGYSLQP